jgi:hypothetical protein
VRRLPLLAGLALLAACGDDGRAAREATVGARIAALRDPSAALRADAAVALAGDPWPEAARAIPYLVIVLDDEVGSVAEVARATLRARAERAAPRVVGTLFALRDAKDAGLADVLSLLTALGAAITPTDLAHVTIAEHPTPPDLPKKGEPSDVEVRRGGAATLAMIGRRVDGARDDEEFRLVAWRAATSDPDAGVRARASDSLAVLGADATRFRTSSGRWTLTLPGADRVALAGLLKGPHPNATVVEGFRTRTPRELAWIAAPFLLMRLPVAGGDVAEGLRAHADAAHEWPSLHVLAEMDPRTLLAAVPEEPTTESQMDALVHAGELGRVRALLGHARRETRLLAATALAEARVLEPAALDVLVQAIEEPGTSFVPRALRLVGRFGPDRGGPARNRLAALRPADASVADSRALALARLSPQGLDLAGTWRAWRAKQPKESQGGWPPPEAFDWALAFDEAVESSRDAARLSALVATLDPAARDEGRLRAAAGALGKMGHAAAPAVPALTSWLSRVDAWRREGTPPRPEVPTLAEVLSLGREAFLAHGYRAPVIEALGRIGPAAKDAVPALESLLSSADERLRHLAARALRRIRGN